jgi:hypothetical protein
MGLRENVEPIVDVLSYFEGLISKAKDRFFMITEGYDDQKFFTKHLRYACSDIVFEAECIARISEKAIEKSGHNRSQLLKIANSPKLSGRRNFVCLIDWDLVHFLPTPQDPLSQQCIAIDAPQPDEIYAIDLESLLVQTGTNGLLDSLDFPDREVQRVFLENLRDAAFVIGSFHAARERLKLQFPATVRTNWSPTLAWMTVEREINSPHPVNNPHRACLRLTSLQVGVCEAELRRLLVESKHWPLDRVDMLCETAMQIRDDIVDPSLRWSVCRGKDLIPLIHLLVNRPNRVPTEKGWVFEKLLDIVQHPDILKRPFMARLTHSLQNFFTTQAPVRVSA